MRRILGIDEAGRGSVLGPLVVGGFLIAADRLSELEELGVRDSKRLTPLRRAELAPQLAALGEARCVELDPRRIDAAVHHHGLNTLETEAFGELVRHFAPHETRADACDVDARRFGREVRRCSGHAAPVRARHHMDRDDRVVGAASIIAKVARDRAIEDLARSLACRIGSGYPGDAMTVAFLTHWLADHPGERAEWVRWSWATTKRLNPRASARTLEEFGR